MEALEFYPEAVEASLWALLKTLCAEPALSEFHLVGGTALALRLGHRRSLDIDMFCQASFDSQALARVLTRKLPVERHYKESDTVSAMINGIKVELISHAYPLLNPVLEVQGIRMASLPDLAAMKLNAISGRGLRKDFYDLAALLDVYSLDEMLGFFQRKYATGDLWHLLKSLSYFEDAEADTSPLDTLHGITWEQVKDKVRNSLLAYTRAYTEG